MKNIITYSSICICILCSFSAHAQVEINFAEFMVHYGEDADSIIVEVTCDGTDTADIEVTIIVEVSSNAKNGVDFILENPSTVIFPANDSSSQFFTIDIIDDTLQEGTEGIMLAIDGLVGNAFNGPDSEHVIFLADNDTTQTQDTTDTTTFMRSYSINNDPMLQAIPNPSKGACSLYLPSSDDWQIIVTDLQGRRVLERSFITSDFLNIEFPKDQSRGLYLIRAYSDKANYQTKLMLQ